MAKVEDQDIPSELLDGYRASLGEERPDHGVRKRYPYRVPTMQSKVGRPSPKQKTQRARFSLAIQKFKATSLPDRQRWYDAMPPWGSFLWYYDFFILSALMGDHYVNSGGLGVIKSIQYVTGTLPEGNPQDVNIAIAEVDPNKTVAMLFGAGYEWDEFVPDTTAAWSVYPYPKAITATQLTIRASGPIDAAAGVGAIVIEYI